MSAADQLTTYGELAEVIDNLPLLVRERRRQMRLSLRAAAVEVGVSAATLSRLENRHGGLDAGSFGAVLWWLDGRESPADVQEDSQ
jgi:transcriptional regulator with XRE-family HTH domain